MSGYSDIGDLPGLSSFSGEPGAVGANVSYSITRGDDDHMRRKLQEYQENQQKQGQLVTKLQAKVRPKARLDSCSRHWSCHSKN